MRHQIRLLRFLLTLTGSAILFAARASGGSAARPQADATAVRHPILVATVGYGYLIPRATLLPPDGRVHDAVADAAKALSPFRAGTVFTVYGGTGQPVAAVPLRLLRVEPGEDSAPTMALTAPAPRDVDAGRLALGVLGGGGSGPPRQPSRPVRTPGVTVADRKTVAAFLVDKGLTAPMPVVARKLVTDLDGDGTEETLLTTVGNGPDRAGRLRNYYSAAILVTHSGRVVPLGAAAVRRGTESQQRRFTVIGVLDVNGDGRREVAVEFAPYEGSGLSLFAWDGTRARILLDGTW